MKLMLTLLCLAALIIGTYAVVTHHMEDTQPKVIILLGPPGSGKGTQAKKLTQELQLPHISTGDLFRANIGQNTELGQRAKQFMDAGKLVPDEVVLDMLFDRVAQDDCSKGYLLDGFPRTIPQAEALDAHLEGKAHVVVVNLQVPDDVVVKRISGRLTCAQCGEMFNTYFTPPKQEGVCDKCGGALTQRSDDKEDVVQERLRVYNAQTAPLVDHYEAKGKILHFDGNRDLDEIYQDILSKI